MISGEDHVEHHAIPPFAVYDRERQDVLISELKKPLLKGERFLVMGHVKQ
jgi:hypothetical protein